MLCIPVDHSYEISVRVEAPENVTGGLVLYYNEECYAGIAAAQSDEGPTAVLWRKSSPWGREVADAPIQGLRLTCDHHEVTFAYDDGSGWKSIRRGMETSGYHHNVFGGFVSLRVGLVACGTGTASFRDFTYQTL